MDRKKIRKILLIQPPSFSNKVRSDMNPNVPLGIAYIAAVLDKGGYQVKMLDAFIEDWHRETRVAPEVILVGMRFEDIKAVIAAEAPDVVGITSMFTFQRRNAHKIAALAKEVDPSIVVIAGGAHPTSAPEMVLPDANIDVIVLGEGDNSIIPLLQAIEMGGDLRTLDGIAFRNGSDVVINEKTHQIADLDSIPFPARHLLPMEKYFSAGVRHGGFSRRDRATSMISSRGCRYRCNFCTAFKVFTRLPRIRSVGNVMAEIEQLVTQFGVNEIFFEDDQFLVKQKHTEEVLDAMIASGFNIVWDTPNGISAWVLNERIISKIAQSGCYRLNIAMESGNQWVLDHIINKPVKIDKLPELVRLIRKYGIQPGTFIVAGNIAENAVETKEQIRDSFRMTRRLGVIPHVSFLTPYPGSEVLEIAQKKGYLIPDFDWDDLVISKQNLQTPEWSPEELRMLVRKEIAKTRISYWLKHPIQMLARMQNSFRRNRVGFLNAIRQGVSDLRFVIGFGD
jgi:anaerobic magnesium-protoporphyrin IX monomethyl ester cyclase